jgi:hypothetical protein
MDTTNFPEKTKYEEPVFTCLGPPPPMGRFAVIAFAALIIVAQSLWIALLAWLATGIFW